MAFKYTLLLLLVLGLFALSVSSSSAPAVKDNGIDWKPSSYKDRSAVREYTRKIKAILAQDTDGAAAWKMFRKWRRDNKKQFADAAEEVEAFKTWYQNLLNVLSINSNPSVTWTAGLHAYSDLTFAEFQAQVLMQPLSINRRLSDAAKNLLKNKTKGHLGVLVPDTVDWVAAGKVSPVKYQGMCGSCWAFSATAAVESAALIASGRMANESGLDLSEEQLVTCNNAAVDPRFPGYGCGGGWSDVAMNFVTQYGQASEAAMPYSHTDTWNTGSCDMAKFRKIAMGDGSARLSSGAAMLLPNSRDALLEAVSRQPVVIYFNVQGDFYNYQSGVYSPTGCGPEINHAMVVVGYNKLTKSWRIRNSWSTWWGQNGYADVRMEDDGQGACGMYQYMYAPVVEFKWLPFTPAPQPAPTKAPSSTRTSTPAPPSATPSSTATRSPPSPSATRTPSSTFTASPSRTPSSTASASPSPTPSSSPSPSPTSTSSPSPTFTSSPSPSSTVTSSSSPSPSPSPDFTSTPSPTPSSSPSPLFAPSFPPSPTPSSDADQVVPTFAPSPTFSLDFSSQSDDSSSKLNINTDTSAPTPSPSRVPTQRVTSGYDLEILWIGNGVISANNLPATFKALAATAGRSVLYETVANGGWTLEQHIFSKTTRNKMLARNWDIFVLQEHSQVATDANLATTSMYPAIRSLVGLKPASSRANLFMTSVRRDSQSLTDVIARTYLDIAQELSVGVSPVAIAWREALVRNPSLPLWASDGASPSQHGTYLTACVFYAALFQAPSAGLTYVPRGVSAADARIMQQAADSIVLNDLYKWGL